MKVEIIFGVLGFGGSLDFNLRQTSSLIKFTRGFESRFTFASTTFFQDGWLEHLQRN